MAEHMSGRRICALGAIYDAILDDRHEPFQCSFVDNKFVKEHKEGFGSTITFECKMCKKITVHKTDMRAANKLCVNRAMVAGALNGGGGNANLAEMAAAADMPGISKPTYIFHENQIGLTVEREAWKSMKEAGERERQLAEAAGDRAPDGTPRIRVVADGTFSRLCHEI